MNAADLERPRALVQEAADVAIDDVVASRLSLTASTLAEICDVDSPVLRSDLLQDAMHHLTQAISDGRHEVRVPARNAQQLLIAAINEDWLSPRRDDPDVRTDGGQIPLLHDDFERCENCSEIVLMHGRGECLELDDAVYCPRCARPHMDDSEWEVRWGEAMRLLTAIREDPTKAIKYSLAGCPSLFWVVYRDGQTYDVWRRCEDDDQRNYLTCSESSLVRDIERRACVSAYVSDPPHIVSAAHAPINADVPTDGEVVGLAY